MAKTETKNSLSTLTNLKGLLYLLNNETEEEMKIKMKGKIRPTSRQIKCKTCNEKFVELKKLGFVCPVCETNSPKRFMIDVFVDKKRYQICSDKTGQAIDTYSRAKKILLDINTEIKQHSFDPSKYIRSLQKDYYISTLLDEFKMEKLGHEDQGEIKDDIAPSYRKDYKLMIERAKEYYKIKDVRDIKKKSDIKKYAEDLKTKYGIGNKTIKNHIDLFHHFLMWCQQEAQVIDIVPPFPEIDYEIRQFLWLNQNDQQDLFQFVPEQDKYMIAGLMLHGYRPGEGRALKCKDVDLQNRTITIIATFSGRVYRMKRKGKRSKPLVIPIHPEMFDYIRDRVKNNHPDAWLFPNKRGTNYSANRLKRIWDIVCKSAGITEGDLRLYDATRHSFASQLINSNTSLAKVSRLLGHSSSKMTEKYTKHEIESLRADVSKLSLNREQTVNIKDFRSKK